jgi:hypothetical protein
MSSRALIILVFAALPAFAAVEQPLPSLHDGIVLAGPGHFRHDGELFVQGRVVLKQMTLDLHGPIRVAENATLEMDDVNLVISDPPNAPNGTSGLRCDGPAHIVVHRSTMTPAGSAHPMWLLQGILEVDHFATRNSEFHLSHVKGELTDLKIFELEISRESEVSARRLDLVFLSTHSSDDDHLQFSRIPVDRLFTQTLALGSGAKVELTDSRLQFFLLYIHGRSEAVLSHMDRVQLAIFPQCEGSLRLPQGRLGSEATPAVFPGAGTSNCPFHITLNDVNVDTWDVYAGGQANLTLDDSQLDELQANDHADITVRNSNIYADWLAVSGDAHMTVERSTVGALHLASRRPDLATSEIHVGGRGHVIFSGARFDCGIVSTDDASVEISHAIVPPKYARHSGNSVIRMDRNQAAPRR